MLEHDRVAIAPARIARITETRPHLTRMLWPGTPIERAMDRERIVSIARLAHLFREPFVRHRVAGPGQDDAIPLPFTQGDPADATGMTAVHVDRMLRRLRDGGMIALAARRRRILDRDRLRAVAGFDPAYPYLDRHPR